ncbi:MAG: NAD-dependent epimerase/dehydratase family protein [Caldilineaceae bacterium]
MSRRKVMVTGASGLIASLLLPALRERYDLVLVDVRTTDRNGVEVDDQIANLADKNRDAYRHLFRGVDAVVHLGFLNTHEKDNVDLYFQNEMINVQMAYNIYQVAWEEGGAPS